MRRSPNPDDEASGSSRTPENERSEVSATSTAGCGAAQERIEREVLTAFGPRLCEREGPARERRRRERPIVFSALNTRYPPVPTLTEHHR